MPTESENHLRQPDDLSTFPWQRFLALRPHLAAGVLLSSVAGPSVVPSVRATCMPGETSTVTPLTRHDLSLPDDSALVVARPHFAAASEQRDGVTFHDGHVDRLSDGWDAPISRLLVKRTAGSAIRASHRAQTSRLMFASTRCTIARRASRELATALPVTRYALPVSRFPSPANV